MSASGYSWIILQPACHYYKLRKNKLLHAWEAMAPVAIMQQPVDAASGMCCVSFFTGIGIFNAAIAQGVVVYLPVRVVCMEDGLSNRKIRHEYREEDGEDDLEGDDSSVARELVAPDSTVTIACKKVQVWICYSPTN